MSQTQAEKDQLPVKPGTLPKLQVHIESIILSLPEDLQGILHRPPSPWPSASTDRAERSGAERSGRGYGRSSWILLKCTCSCRSAALELTMLALPKPHRKWPRTNDGRTHARVTDTFCWTSHRVRFTFPSLLNMKMDLGMTVLGHRSVWSESHETGPEHAQGVFHPQNEELRFCLKKLSIFEVYYILTPWHCFISPELQVHYIVIYIYIYINSVMIHTFSYSNYLW